jgi:hypothetical protein
MAKGSEYPTRRNAMSQGGLERKDHPTGAVFYLLRENQVTRRWCQQAAQRTAELLVNGFVVRYGERDGEEPGTYWVGFNAADPCGRYFEHYLTESLKRRKARYQEKYPQVTTLPADKEFLSVRRVYALPGPNPHPWLPPVIQGLVPDDRPKPPPPATSPAVERPAPPAGRGGLMDQAALARQRMREEGINIGGVGQALSGLADKIPERYRRRLGRRRRGGDDEES